MNLDDLHEFLSWCALLVIVPLGGFAALVLPIPWWLTGLLTLAVPAGVCGPRVGGDASPDRLCHTANRAPADARPSLDRCGAGGDCRHRAGGHRLLPACRSAHGAEGLRSTPDDPHWRPGRVLPSQNTLFVPRAYLSNNRAAIAHLDRRVGSAASQHEPGEE